MNNSYAAFAARDLMVQYRLEAFRRDSNTTWRTHFVNLRGFIQRVQFLQRSQATGQGDQSAGLAGIKALK